MNSSIVKRAAIYARISQADKEVDKVENQISEMRKFAESNGYEVVAVHQDDDISAYGGKSPRAGFVALVDGLKAGSYDVVLATEPQRLTRGSSQELELLQVYCIRAGAVIHTRAAGLQDPATPGSKAMMKMMDVIAGFEIDTKIERQKARTRADLSHGIPTKGIRAFGWEPDRITIRESEASVIRDAYQGILQRGESLWSVAQKWNDLKIRTDGMSRERKSKADGVKRLPSPIWTNTTVRQILLRERNAGILMHDGDEMPISKIQPIVTREDLEALRKVVKGIPMPKGPKPQYLLGGLIECICGERMHASKSLTARKGKTRREYRVYRCRVYGFDKSQPHVTIQQPIADRAVKEYIIVNLGLKLDEFLIFDEQRLREIQEEIADLNSEEVEVEEMIAKKVGNKPRNYGRLRAIDAKRTELSHELDEVLSNNEPSAALSKYIEEMSSLSKYSSIYEEDRLIKQGLEAWDALPIDTQRAIVRGKYRVTVEAGGRGFERVHVEQR